MYRVPGTSFVLRENKTEHTYLATRTLPSARASVGPTGPQYFSWRSAEAHGKLVAATLSPFFPRTVEPNSLASTFFIAP